MEFAINQQHLKALSEEIAAMSHHTQGEFQYTLLDRNAALDIQPGLGGSVARVVYSPQDSQVNPLYLLAALHKANQLLGVK